MGGMARFQFSLRVLLASAFAACILAYIGGIVARDMAVGKINDLPVLEKRVLAAIASHGIWVVDGFS